MIKLSIIKLRDRPDAKQLIVQWIHKEWGEFSGRSLKETDIRYSQELCCDDPLPHTLVALDNGVPIGLASLRTHDSTNWDPGTTPWICNVYVSDEARGMGVAGKLCRALEAVALTQGYSETFLGTTMSEDSLYHRLGYVQYKIYEGKNAPHYLLRHKLI